MIFSYRGDAVTTYCLRTDGQTDRQTAGRRTDAYRISSTGAKIALRTKWFSGDVLYLVRTYFTETSKDSVPISH